MDSNRPRSIPKRMVDGVDSGVVEDLRSLNDSGLSKSHIEDARKFLFESDDEDVEDVNFKDTPEDDVEDFKSFQMPYKTNLSNSSNRNRSLRSDFWFCRSRDKNRRCINTLAYHKGHLQMKILKILAGITFLFTLIGVIVWVEQHRRQNSSSSSIDHSSSSKNNIKASKIRLHGTRLERFHEEILGLGLSSKEDLETQGTPQHNAVQWIADLDGAKLKADDPLAMERYALAVFYHASGGTNFWAPHMTDTDNGDWTTAQQWLSEAGICAWHGIVCAGDDPSDTDVMHKDHHGSVSFLELPENDMVGKLPSELRALTTLYTLDLSANQLTGTLPKQFGALKRLRVMNLRDNRLSGTIPTSYGHNLKNMRELNLGENKLDGPIPSQLDQMVDLRSLVLNSNELTGGVPDLGSMAKLTHLDVKDNQLEGPFPKHLSKLTGLVSLNLSRNHLTGVLPEELAELTRLERLLLREMNLVGTIPPTIFGRVTRLTELAISNNKLTGQIPTTIAYLKDLHHFFLDENNLGGSIPRQVGLMAELSVLELQGNQIGGTIPDPISALHGLEHVNLGRNKLTGAIPSEIGQMHRLETLFLESNLLEGAVPTELGHLQTLKQARLYQNKFEGSIPAEVCELTTDEDLIYLGADCSDTFECECCSTCF